MWHRRTRRWVATRTVTMGEHRFDLRWLERFSTLLRIPAGRCFFRAGERGAEVVLVAGGVASVHAAGSGAYLGTVGAGDLCGELSVLTPGLRRADVVANTDVWALVMAPNELHSWMSADAGFARLVWDQAMAHSGGGSGL